MNLHNLKYKFVNANNLINNNLSTNSINADQSNFSIDANYFNKCLKWCYSANKQQHLLIGIVIGIILIIALQWLKKQYKTRKTYISKKLDKYY